MNKLSRRKFIKAGILIISGAILADALWVERYFFEVNEFFGEGASKDADNIKMV
jgi:hypothetical protein